MKKATPRAGGKGGQGLLDESFELPLARSALLVIDVQNDFLGLSADCKAILKPLQGLMKTFRERHLPLAIRAKDVPDPPSPCFFFLPKEVCQ